MIQWARKASGYYIGSDDQGRSWVIMKFDGQWYVSVDQNKLYMLACRLLSTAKGLSQRMASGGRYCQRTRDEMIAASQRSDIYSALGADTAYMAITTQHNQNTNERRNDDKKTDSDSKKHSIGMETGLQNMGHSKRRNRRAVATRRTGQRVLHCVAY